MPLPAGAPGTVVLADEQTAGQGRHGHSWHSEPRARHLLLAGAAADARCSRSPSGSPPPKPSPQATGMACDLRWPNDLMLADRKVAGILVQLVGRQRHRRHRHQRQPHRFPGDSPRWPLRCARHAGRDSRAKTFCSRCCPPSTPSVAQRRARPFSRLFTHASSYAVRPARRRSTSPTASIEGTTAGLDPAGFLIVRQDDGTDTLILAGGVRAAGS